MTCSECGATRAAMKTVRWVGEEEEWELCDLCFAGVDGEVLIVPGQFDVWGWCNEHKGWCSLNHMARWSGGGPRDAPQGSCLGCAG